MKDSVVIHGSLDKTQVKAMRRTLRIQQETLIHEIASGITMDDCEKMGNGECTTGCALGLLPYFGHAPAMIAMTTAKYATKRVYQIFETMKKLRESRRTDLTQSLKMMHTILSDMTTRYDELTFRRDKNWFFTPADLTKMASEGPMYVVARLHKGRVIQQEQPTHRKLEITLPHNSDVICGFGRVLCARLLEKQPGEEYWDLPVTGHFMHPSPFRKAPLQEKGGTIE